MHDLIYHYDSPDKVKAGKYLGNRPKRMLLNNIVLIYSLYNGIAIPFTKKINIKLWAFYTYTMTYT